MNKTQLAKAILDEVSAGDDDAEWRLGDVKAVLDAMETVIINTTTSGEAVNFPSFCKFNVVDRPARMGRNPATGEAIKIKAKRAVKITPLKGYKDAALNTKKRGR